MVLNFFATYCLPCLEEIPELQDLAKLWQDKIVVVLIDLKEESAKVKAFIEKNQIGLPVLLDRHGVVVEKYNVESLPALYLIDKGGIIRYLQKGYDQEIGKYLNNEIKNSNNEKIEFFENNYSL